MKFDYNMYFRQNCILPLFFGTLSIIVLTIMVISLCKDFFSQNSPGWLKANLSELLFLLIPLIILTLNIVNISRGGIFLLSEKEKDAVNVTGVIERTIEIDSLTGSKYGVENNRGFGEIIVVDGKKYKLMTYGDLREGDFVKMEVLPRSGYVLRIDKAGNYEPENCVAKLSDMGGIKSYDYEEYRNNNLKIPIISVLILCLLFIMLTYNLISDITVLDTRQWLKANIPTCIFTVFVLFLAYRPIFLLKRGGIYLISEKETDAVKVYGIVEKTEKNNKLSSVNFDFGNRDRGEKIYINGKEYYIMISEDVKAGDNVEIDVLPKSKFILRLKKLTVTA